MAEDPTDRLRAEAPEPAEPFGTMRRSRGTVKWWRDAKGYGVISVPEIAPWDIWCHFSALEAGLVNAEGIRSLTQGEAVDVEYYRASQDSFRYAARSVQRATSDQ